MPAYRGRFAPSPTGALHLGSAVAAVFCAAAALQAQGALVLRLEDIDRPRVVPGSAESILDDLRWLGLRFHEGPREGGPFGPYVQSERETLYLSALKQLEDQGLVYLCDCSRADIARVASAPHVGDEGPRYPGTCRPFGMQKRAFRRPPAIRLAVPEDASAVVTTVDLVLGTETENVAESTGDFVLRRGDGIFAYQLAVVVDDLAMNITDVVRGHDLASSKARQTLLATLLGGTAPRFAHLPLLVAADGRRLAKREHGMTLADQRAMGADPHALIASIAHAYGHTLSGTEPALLELAACLDWRKLPKTDVLVSDSRGTTRL